jgi:hypothetical protein
MKLYTSAQLDQLIANGRKSRECDGDFDPIPVVKWFTPFGGATWLITEIDPDNRLLAFGLADLGLRFPEVGFVSVSEIEGLKGPGGLGVERDLHFKAQHPLSVYAEIARNNSRIVA